ncbi:hypothetical protein [Kineococcus sp. NPDC059986]|uniref:hypothetical protein n=1 Tax=Actinomycetes TaxID=1760 RepID=UPI003450D4C5
MSSPAFKHRRLKRKLREVMAPLDRAGVVTQYDRRGRPIPAWRWAWLFENWKGYRRVARTEVGDAVVTTIWDGLDHDLFDSRPRIFETAVKRPTKGYDIIGRWPDEATALLGHEATVNEVKAQLRWEDYERA